MVTSPASGAELPIGPTLVTYTVSDGNGNSAEFDVTVTVVGQRSFKANVLCNAQFEKLGKENLYWTGTRTRDL